MKIIKYSFSGPFRSVHFFILAFLLFSCDPILDDDGPSSEVSVSDDVPASSDDAAPSPEVKYFKPFLISSVKDFVEAKEVPAKSALGNLSQALQDILGPIVGNSPKPLGVLYVSVGGGAATEDGSTENDGSSWEKAYAAAQLKTAIDNAGRYSKTKNPYLVVLGPGIYHISAELSMKNNVAIVGGFAEDDSGRGTKVVLRGDGNETRIFQNNRIGRSAVLYGVTITNGHAVEGGGMRNYKSSPHIIRVVFSANDGGLRGGGMYNSGSSYPTIRQVVFSGNWAASGGGMYNFRLPEPRLREVVFSGNRAIALAGGGMINNNAAPKLTKVVFLGNTATTDGGGMLNESGSAPRLDQVVFSGNKANRDGGGMINLISDPLLMQVVFSGNKANRGGGMYNFNPKFDGPKVINSLFWGNTVGNGKSQQIHIGNNTSAGLERINISYTVLEGGLAGFTYSDPVAATAAENVSIVSAGIIDKDPLLSDYKFDLFPGAEVTIPAISVGSSAINQGLYIKETPSNLLFIETPSFSGSAINLTARDITGYARTGRPDIGVYEAR